MREFGKAVYSMLERLLKIEGVGARILIDGADTVTRCCFARTRELACVKVDDRCDDNGRIERRREVWSPEVSS